ncbi:hypothetical protein AB1Y20_006173 [Prymnesium parvum]|uniref:WW domain-containing protein n=1 Tax=Prymnesium parvum TaxID=97485 RepID=A0AB34J4D3_PRYPA
MIQTPRPLLKNIPHPASGGDKGSTQHTQKKGGQTINEMARYLGMDPVRDKHLMWIAACAMREPPTPGWDEATSSDGQPYFVNVYTGESAWRLPSDEKYRQMYERRRQSIPPPSKPLAPPTKSALAAPAADAASPSVGRAQSLGARASSARSARPHASPRQSDYWESFVPQLTPRGIEKAPLWQRRVIESVRTRLTMRERPPPRPATARPPSTPSRGSFRARRAEAPASARAASPRLESLYGARATERANRKVYYEEQAVQMVLEEQQLSRMIAEKEKQLEAAEARKRQRRAREKRSATTLTSLATRLAGVQQRLVMTEQRCSELVKYNETLTAVIDQLRRQRNEHLRAMSACDAKERKMSRDLHALQGYTESELNTRDRLIRLRRRVEDDAVSDVKQTVAMDEQLRAEVVQLDEQAKQFEAQQDSITERERQHQYKSMRLDRIASSKREVMYGYMRSKLEGWREQLRQVQLVAEVRKPGGVLMNEKAWATMSAGLLTSAYATNETRNRSMLMHLERVLHPQAASLEEQVAALEAQCKALEEARRNGGEAAEGSGEAEAQVEAEKRQAKWLMSLGERTAALEEALAELEAPIGALAALSHLGLTPPAPSRDAPSRGAPFGLDVAHELVDMAWHRAQELGGVRARAEAEEMEAGAQSEAAELLHRWVEHRSDLELQPPHEIVTQIKRAVHKLSVHRTEEDDVEEEEAGYNPYTPIPRGAFVPTKSSISVVPEVARRVESSETCSDIEAPHASKRGHSAQPRRTHARVGLTSRPMTAHPAKAEEHTLPAKKEPAVQGRREEPATTGKMVELATPARTEEPAVGPGARSSALADLA